MFVFGCGYRYSTFGCLHYAVEGEFSGLAKIQRYTGDSCGYEESYVMEVLRKWPGITLLEPHMAWQVWRRTRNLRVHPSPTYPFSRVCFILNQ